MTASDVSNKILKNLLVNDLSRGGNGVAREERRVIFLPLTLTGDVVTARIISENKRFATAEVVEVTTPSPDRITPRCAIFGKCGGCTWQHVPYDRQWKTKREGVLNALSRTPVKFDGITLKEFPAENPWNYRNRIQLRANGVLFENGKLETTLGYFARNSNDLVGVERCEIAREELNALLPKLKTEAEAKLKEQVRTGEKSPELKVEIDVLPDGTTRRAWNARHGSLGFRQINDEQNEKLRGYVRDSLTSGSHIFDLFGGAGNFTLDDASRYDWVECVDLGSPEGGFQDQPGNFKFFKSNVARWLDRRAKEFEMGIFKPNGPIEVVLDPPREGLSDQSDKIISALDLLGVEKIIAIGCDADSWARDLTRFVTAGWKVTDAAVFDLFPQTPHIESVAVLTR